MHHINSQLSIVMAVTIHWNGHVYIDASLQKYQKKSLILPFFCSVSFVCVLGSVSVEKLLQLRKSMPNMRIHTHTQAKRVSVACEGDRPP